MAEKLQLSIVLNAIDKAKAVFQGTQKEARALANAFAQSQKTLKNLNTDLGNIEGLKKLREQATASGEALRQAKQNISQYTQKIQQSKIAQEALGAKLNVAKQDYLSLSATIAKGGAVEAASLGALHLKKQAFEKLQQQYSAATNAQNRMQSALNGENATLKKVTDQRKSLASRLVEQSRALENAGIKTHQLNQTESALKNKIQSANSVIDQQKAKLEKLNVIQAKLNKNKAAFNNQKQLAGNLKSAGVGMGIAGAVIGAPVVAAASAHMDFEKAMLGVARQMEGAKDANGNYTSAYFEMGDAVKNMSERLPIAANEIAAIVEGGARMGIQGKDNLLTFTNMTAVMSSAFDLPVDQVGQDIGQLSQLYKIPIKNIQQLGDTINWLDDNALSKGGDIIGVMKRIAGTADMVKMDFKEAAALGSTFLSLGANEEVAASASNAMMRELSIATMQKGKFQDGMKMLNLKAADVQLGMTKDATGTIQNVLAAIKKLPEEKQLEAATRLFGKEYGDDAAKLAANMSEYHRQLALVNDEKAKGSMDRESDTRNKSSGAQWEMAKNSMTNLSAEIGKSLAPEIINISKSVVALSQSFRSWANENPKTIAFIAKFAAIAAICLVVLGGLTLGIASVIVPIAALRFGFAVLGIKGFSAFGLISKGLGLLKGVLLANPIAAGIALAIAAIYLLWRNWDTVKASLLGIWKEIKDGFSNGFVNGINMILLNWNPLGIIYRIIAGVLNYFGFDLPLKFSEAGANILTGLIDGLFGEGALARLNAAVSGIATKVTGWFKAALGINSPSRVFMGFGGFINDGLAIGMETNTAPLQAVNKLAKKVTAAGAGIAFAGALAASPMTDDLINQTIDTRPAMQSAQGAANNAIAPNYTFHIYTQPNQNAQEIAQEVMRAIQNKTPPAHGMNPSLRD